MLRRTMMKSPLMRGFVAASAALALPALGAAQVERETGGGYSPFADRPAPRNVYFGDLHLHTRNSPDAYGFGTRALGPDDAYRFAKGAQMEAENGEPVRLSRPLDFLAVTDHAEFLGLSWGLANGDPVLSATPVGARLQAAEAEAAAAAIGEAFVVSILDPDPERDRLPLKARQSIWDEVAAAADRHYKPGVFTTFSGYEWTSMVDGNNLHRCVIFKDGAERVTQITPFSAQDSRDPEDLWAALEAYEAKTGGEALSIPHNGNISNGMMFARETLAGEPLGAAYARARARWEPVYEVTQVKGDGETHPVLSPTDEFADFERWDRFNIMETHPFSPETAPGSYARTALGRGLEIEAEIGANPFQFGMIGSTDGHNAYTTMREDNFFGKFANSEPGPQRSDTAMAGGSNPDWALSASGLAAVWAEENTREALFAAMKRREVYATTGSRIALRMFAGWAFAPEDIERADYAAIGYAHGVPMGGVLLKDDDAARAAPRFLVMAAKDPENANLDRIQIIKGWLNAAGEARYEIHDVALSDGRVVDPNTGKAPPVGSTVDVEAARYRNSIGAAQLSAYWEDPAFDPDRPAFYYARVIEIPKPRWTAYDSKAFGSSFGEEAPMTVQDRAYSSPIWYRP